MEVERKEEEEGEGDDDGTTVGLVAAMLGQNLEGDLSEKREEFEKCCVLSADFISKFLWNMHRKTENNKINHQRSLMKQAAQREEVPSGEVPIKKKRKWNKKTSPASSVSINIFNHQNTSGGGDNSTSFRSRYGKFNDYYRCSSSISSHHHPAIMHCFCLLINIYYITE